MTRSTADGVKELLSYILLHTLIYKYIKASVTGLITLLHFAAQHRSQNTFALSPLVQYYLLKDSFYNVELIFIDLAIIPVINVDIVLTRLINEI